MLQIAKISHNGQITIPLDIRNALHLKAGDALAWNIENDGRIFIRRVEPNDFDYLYAVSSTLTEWNSAEDDEAYRDL